MQYQSEKEKYAYDYESMQSQLDKSAGQLSRIQKEKENIQQEMERIRDKHDKNQACLSRCSALALSIRSLQRHPFLTSCTAYSTYCVNPISFAVVCCRRCFYVYKKSGIPVHRKWSLCKKSWNCSSPKLPRPIVTVNSYSARPKTVGSDTTNLTRISSRLRFLHYSVLFYPTK